MQTDPISIILFLFLFFFLLQIALREALSLAHRCRLQEHRHASFWFHQVADTISHEIEAYTIISHICQHFTNYAELIASICTAPDVFQAILNTFGSANYSLSQGPAAHRNSLYHVVHSLPHEVLVQYPTILRYFAKRGYPLSSADIKKREEDRLHGPIPPKMPSSSQSPHVTTSMPGPPVATGPSSDSVSVKKPSQAHVSVLPLSKIQGPYRSSSSKLAGARKSDPKK